MRSSILSRTLARFVIPLAAAAVLSAQVKSNSKGDWPMFLHDLAGTRYSPLDQINAGNVAQLKQSWFYVFNREGKKIRGLSPTELFQEITPIVVNGVMYLPAGDCIVALEV